MKKRIIIVFGAVLAVVVAWSAAWLFVAGRIDAEVVRLATPADASVPTLDCAEHNVAGWPFRFDVTCAGARIVAGDATFTVPQIKATALVYDPWHVLAFFTGPLHYSDAFYGTERELRWSLMEMSGHLDGWRLARVSIHGETIAAYDRLIGDTLLAKASLAELHILGEPQKHDKARHLSDLAIYARTDAVGIPSAAVTGGRMTFDAEITALPDDVRLWSDPAILRRWQQAGGIVTINGLKADDADTRVAVAGKLGLSATGEVEGNLTVTSNGVAERLAAVIPSNLRAAVFGSKAADGSYSQAITIRRGGIFAGLAPLMAIPPLF